MNPSCTHLRTDGAGRPASQPAPAPVADTAGGLSVRWVVHTVGPVPTRGRERAWATGSTAAPGCSGASGTDVRGLAR
ncbi:hypothetical protein GCM10009599_09590 [Luteococcus peritonei]